MYRVFEALDELGGEGGRLRRAATAGERDHDDCRDGQNRFRQRRPPHEPGPDTAAQRRRRCDPENRHPEARESPVEPLPPNLILSARPHEAGWSLSAIFSFATMPRDLY